LRLLTLEGGDDGIRVEYADSFTEAKRLRQGSLRNHAQYGRAAHAETADQVGQA
jgi:hypothetical protein